MIKGVIAGNFDVIHPGYIAMFNECKNHCDYLIAGLQTDPTLDRASKNAPIQSVVERQIQLGCNRFVDEIVVYQTEKDLQDILLTLPIDVRILGVEYENKDFTGKDICMNRGIEIVYNGRDHSFSSSNLRKRVADAENNNK